MHVYTKTIEHSAIQPNSRIQIQDTSDTIQEAFIKSYLLNWLH